MQFILGHHQTELFPEASTDGAPLFSPAEPTPAEKATPKYIYHQDPGHGWIEVPLTELRRLGIADKISSYSYQRQGQAFLEEDGDCDTWHFAKQEVGEDYETIKRHTNNESPIRNYTPYKA